MANLCIKVLLFLVFLSLYIFNTKQGESNYISLILIIFVSYIFLIQVFINKYLVISKIFVWYFVFAIISIFSYFYSITPHIVIEKIPMFLINLTLILMLTNFI